MALEPWRKAIIKRVEQQTHNTRRYFMEVPELTDFNFKPGQFVTLDLPIDEKPNKRWRSYSIASWPGGNNEFELCIVLNEAGKGTPYLFNESGVGTEINYRGPVGVFTLPESLDHDVFLICTGTGIAPFRSMIHHIINNKIPHKNIYLVFGCRKYGDALYNDEIKALMQQDPNFFFYSVYSREDPQDHDEFVKFGYVHAQYEALCIKQKEQSGGTLNPAHFYLCGWKNMVDEAKQRILALGYDKKAIHQELYG
ncbi:MAG: FAD-dependent oxidoreductase [Niastella sp.]|nr:FAD-dependent oxidoreductase [Niastella sp.]